MSDVKHAELVNLDATIAAFILPRLQAFRAITKTYPSDLSTYEQWLAELDLMIEAFTLVAGLTEDNVIRGVLPAEDSRPGRRLFAERLDHLWL
jgi:hypothetical protein